MILHRLPTRGGFNLRRIDVPCKFYVCLVYLNKKMKTTFLFFCNLAHKLWNWVIKWCEVNPLVFTSVMNRFVVVGIGLRLEKKKCILIIATLWWYIWKYRNTLSFDGKKTRKDCLFDSIVSTYFYWIHNPYITVNLVRFIGFKIQLFCKFS